MILECSKRILALGLCAVLLPCASLAQQSTPEPTADGEIEEIIVTARRREENPQLVPVAVTALSAEDLQERMIFDIEDLGEFAPNVTMTSGTGDWRQIVIRGIGGGSANNRDSFGAGVYIDGVFIPGNSAAYMSTLAVERTEVLRGPQGTMFGKNTTGGAVNIITERPGPDFDASIVLRAGDFGQRDIRASVNLPIIDEKLFFRGALALEHDDGYYTELTTGKGYDDNERRELYLSTRWLANEHWTVDVTGQYSDRPRNGRGGNCNFISRTFFNGTLHESGGGGDFESACDASRDAGPYNFYSDIDGFLDVTSTRLFAIATWDSDGPTGRLDSSSVKLSAAFHEATQQFLAERDWTIERLLSIGRFVSPSGEEIERGSEVSSFEAIYQATALSGRFDLILGYNYFSDETFPESEDCGALYGTVAGTGQSVVCSSPTGLYVDILPLNITGRSAVPRGQEGFADNSSNAVFFHGTFDLTENLFVDFGGRWTSERRGFDSLTWTPLNAPQGRENLIHELNDNTVSVFEQDVGEWEFFTSAAGLSWRLANSRFANLDEGIAYISYSSGFNSGGFNFGIPQELLGAFYAYGPEDVQAYEIGFKSTWGGGRVRFNIAAFLTDYADKQVRIFVENAEELFGDPDVGFTDNVAEVEITGVEIETSLRTNSGFVFQAAASYLSNKFTEYNSFDPDQGLPLDLSDAFIQDLTPDYTLSATVLYTFNLPDGATLTPRAGVYWQDDHDYAQQFTDSPASDCTQEAYSKFNARLTWANAGRNMQLALFGTNITDELILRTCSQSAVRGRSLQYSAPARWGIEATVLFGQ